MPITRPFVAEILTPSERIAASFASQEPTAISGHASTRKCERQVFEHSEEVYGGGILVSSSRSRSATTSVLCSGKVLASKIGAIAVVRAMPPNLQRSSRPIAVCDSAN